MMKHKDSSSQAPQNDSVKPISTVSRPDHEGIFDVQPSGS
jgi:hypothetical protein